MGVGVRQGFPSLPVAFLLLIVRGQWLVPSQGCTLPFFQQLFLLLPSLNEISTPIPRRLNMFFRLLVIASFLLFLASALPFNQSTISSPSEESGPHHSLATLLYSVLMQEEAEDADISALP